MTIAKQIIAAFCLFMTISMSFAQDQLSPELEVLKSNLSKMKSISEAEFLKSLPAEVNGFKLDEPQFQPAEDYPANGTINYTNGETSIFIMITDGAALGSDGAIYTVLSHKALAEMSAEDLGDHMKVVDFKGTKAIFDETPNDDQIVSSIQYFDGKRFSIDATGNNVSIKDLQKFMEVFPY